MIEPKYSKSEPAIFIRVGVLRRQLLQQRLRFLQIARVKALREPAVDRERAISRSLICFGRLLIPDRNGNNRHSAVHQLARELILSLDSELPDGGVSVVRFYAN